jgi:hypothetical protein
MKNALVALALSKRMQLLKLAKIGARLLLIPIQRAQPHSSSIPSQVCFMDKAHNATHRDLAKCSPTWQPLTILTISEEMSPFNKDYILHRSRCRAEHAEDQNRDGRYRTILSSTFPSSSTGVSYAGVAAKVRLIRLIFPPCPASSQITAASQQYSDTSWNETNAFLLNSIETRHHSFEPHLLPQ